MPECLKNLKVTDYADNKLLIYLELKAQQFVIRRITNKLMVHLFNAVIYKIGLYSN